MSATEDAVATNQAPPSPAPSNDAAAGPANGDAAAPAAGTEAGPNGNNSTEAPKSSRTSARAKAASSSAPVSKKADREEKPKSEKPKPRASTSGGAAAPSKKAAGGSKGDSEKGFNVGDIVLARLKGYPPWPARVADPDNVPRKVAESRPSKNPSIYGVQFFPVGDYAWLHAREITLLTPSDISEYLSQTHRKATGGLREAYQTAQDPTEWDEGQKAILDQQAAENDDVDELEEEDAEVGDKRKKASASKPKKKAKTEASDEPVKSKSKAAKPKSSTAKASKAPESKPADKEAGGDDEGTSDPESIKVKDWRHKLQRAFLGKGVPTAEEMPTYDDLFKTIEAYNGMTIEALQYSKIGKVMKKIAAMDNIPRNDEFTITDRAQKLMNDWHTYIESAHQGENGDAKGGE